MSARAVFLDRDGVLVRAPVVDGRPQSIRRLEELELESGAVESCDELRDAGFVLVVVTNQPDVARGLLSRDELDRINGRVHELLAVDEIVVCPHDDPDGCECRKPLPGMLVQAAARLGIDLASSYMVGDRWRDVGAGNRAGCTSVLLKRDYSEAMTERADVTVESLEDAVAWILGSSSL